MPLLLNEEQRLVKDTAAEFLNKHAPVDQLRKLRDEKDPLGYSSDTWQQAAELGWAGMTIPEDYDGLGFGFMGLGAVLEQSGRTLTASPLFATVVLGASAIELAGSDAQKQRLLPQVASGELTLTLALEEGHHHNPSDISTTAKDGVLSGKKSLVIDGHSADKLIVVAKTDEGLGLFIVDGDAEGLARHRMIMTDSRNAARLVLNNVKGEQLGSGDASAALETVLDRGRICLAAEMLGGALECFDRTVAYLKEREQFGVKIGSFQALQHRAAILYAELEMSKSVVLDGLSAIDENRDDLAKAASLAKKRLNDVYQLATNEAVQMHGGIGVTDELDIGFFLKRARVAMQLLGDSSFHSDRWATLEGY